jgi:hypothetical protein
MRCPVATRETETMTTPEDCYQAWKSHFETDAWRAKSVGSMCAVSAFYFHWAGEGDITRPAEDVQFDRLVGISSCYQYFMLREGEVHFVLVSFLLWRCGIWPRIGHLPHLGI